MGADRREDRPLAGVDLRRLPRPDVDGLDEDEMVLLQAIPYRGSLPNAVPTDPLIYRFYELVMVYGTTWKELIQEEFGDGIMSAIDFDMTLERQPDQKGDRVKIGMSGKFLAYKQY
jgi:cyanate lyase